MRIALLTDGIWPFVIGGMQKHSYYLCKYFAQNKTYVELFHSAKKEAEIELEKYFSAEELPFINSHFVQKHVAGKLPGHYVRDSYKYSQNVFQLLIKSIDNGLQIDFIYAKGLAGWETIRQRKAGTKLPPIGLNVHGYEYYQKTASMSHRLQQIFLKPAFRRNNEGADYIFSYGGKITEIILQHISGSKNKIIEIPTGIEADFLRKESVLTEAGRNFVFLGRNERRKGIIELKEALGRLLSKRSFTFHFIGDIPSDQQLKDPAVIYHGVLRDKELISAILKNAQVLVCPSYSEGMPNVILEGMASGCAIIATDVGAINRQVDQENGWLIEAGSVQGIVDAMTEAIDMDDQRLSVLRNRSVQKVKEHFLWEKVILQKIKAIKSVLTNEGN